MSVKKYKFSFFKRSHSRAAIVLSVIITVFLIILGSISGKYVQYSEQQRLMQLKQLVQIARSTIEPTLHDYRSGFLSKENAINNIRNTVRNMVFTEEHGSNYIFMSSYSGIMLVQPFEPGKEMINQWELRDSDGQYIIRGLVDIARTQKNGGYFTYKYRPPGRDEPEEKISYVIGIDELECYIGTGRYMGDLRREQRIFQIKVISLELFLIILILLYFLILNNEIRVKNDKLSDEIRTRKLSEVDLLNEKIRLRTLIETIPDLIWLKDENGIYLFCNPQFERFFGKAESEIIGKTDYQFVNKNLADSFRENDLKAMSNDGPSINEEEVVYADDGHKELLETIKTPMYDSKGKLIGILGISREITRRKQQEQEVLHLHSYVSNIIDSMPSHIIGIDERGCISRWNKKMESYTGIAAEDALELPIHSVLPQLSMDIESIIRAIRENRVIRDRRNMRIVDNQILYEAVTVYPLLGEGERGAVVKIDDETEKVHLEEMMIQSEKMLSIGGLAAGMAHEINNPLAGMIQTAAVMSKRLTSETISANIAAAEESGTDMQSIKMFMEKRKILTMLQSIKESGRRAAQIIENMLSFSRKSDFSLSSQDPAALMDHILELASSDYNLEKQYDFRKIRIIKEYDEYLPEIVCDKGKIQQVFLNILRNGAEAMYNSSVVCPERDSPKEEPQFIIRIQHKIRSKVLQIEVADNGPGMSESLRKRIFEPFFTTKSIGSGTGLGLSISYFIITENHKGTMSVESHPCKGTTFIIQLPVGGA